jgi:hypothetical protein
MIKKAETEHRALRKRAHREGPEIKKRVNFDLPAKEHVKLKIHAAREGKTISELLTKYVARLPENI